MTPRTKWLLIGGAAVFSLYMVDSLYRTWVEQPSLQLNAELDAKTEKISDSQGDQLLAQKVGKRLEQYAARSLPDDPQLARDRKSVV